MMGNRAGNRRVYFTDYIDGKMHIGEVSECGGQWCWMLMAEDYTYSALGCEFRTRWGAKRDLMRFIKGRKRMLEDA